MGKLDDKVAIVTGAAQGIGAVYAEALAREGAKVVLTDIHDCGPAAARIADAVAGAETAALTADVSDEQSVAGLVDDTLARFGRLDILVNNAAVFGTIEMKPFDQITVAEWDGLMAVNVRGVFLCCKAAIAPMRAQKYGKIVNIASDTILKGVPHFLHYVTSKGAVFALTRALATEVGEDGVCVNTLAPGLTLSETVRSKAELMKDDLTMVRNSRALKRDQESQDMVGALIFLASPDSDFMTGQYMTVNGGDAYH